MPDIGLNPPSSGNVHSFTGVATVAGIKFAHVVVAAPGTINHADVALPAGAAATAVMGIVTDQMGPTGSAIGDTISIRDAGDAEVYLDIGQSVNVDDVLITGATPGTVKPVGNEPAPYDVVGRSLQKYTNDTGVPSRISCRLVIQRRFS
jgi:hypothetical protein